MIVISEFYKNIARMGIGVGSAQALTLLAYPIIARIFTPSDFGLAALFFSYLAVLVIPSTLRLEHAIVLPDSKSEVVDIASVAVAWLFIYTVIVAMTLAVVFLMFPELFELIKLGNLSYLIAIAIYFTGLAQLMTGWSTSEKKFGAIGRSNFMQALSIVVSRVSCGWLAGSSALILILTHIMGVFVRLLLLIKAVDGWSHAIQIKGTLARAKRIVGKYRQFPLFSVPTGFVRALNENLPVIMMALLFGPATAGLYAMASRLIRVPTQVIGEPIRLAFLERASRLSTSNAALFKELSKLTLVLLFASLVIIVPLVFFGEQLFSIVLGDKWSVAGIYAAVIAPWFSTVFMQIPSACLYIVRKKQNQLLVFQSIATVAIAAIATATYFLGLKVVYCLALLSLTGTLLNVVIIVNAFFMIRGGDKAALKMTVELK